MAARQAADALGICFHVGSQAMTPAAYSEAMSRVRDAIVEAAVTVDIVDVGGGFPSSYPGMEPPPLEAYFEVIHNAFEALPISYSAELWCEPGRALCAEYAAVLVRVEKRRGDELYINDGAYGALFDAAHIGWRYPVELIRDGRIGRRAIWRSASTARPATISTAWPARSMLPGDVQAGRLYRNRHARRLWLRDAHRLQRLRGRGPGDRRRRADGLALWSGRASRRVPTSSSCKSSASRAGRDPQYQVEPRPARGSAAIAWSLKMTTDTLNKVHDEAKINDTRKAELLSSARSSISTSPASTRARSSMRWAR